MAKVKGPIFSLAAHGSIKKTITYQGRPSGTAVFGHTVPYDPKTITQKNIRVYVERGVYCWHNLSAGYITSWNNFVN